MKKTILLLVIIISGNHLFAQSNPKLKELMSDPNITWIGEYETYFPFDIVNSFLDTMSAKDLLLETEGGVYFRAKDIYSKKIQEKLGVEGIGIEKVKQMRSINSKDKYGIYPYYQCNVLLLDWVKSGVLKAYFDSDLRQEITKDKLAFLGTRLDTVIHFDPETFEEKDTVIVNELDPREFKLTKAKFYVYYNNSIHNWNIYTLSIAVVAEKYDIDGNLKSYENLFWIPVNNDTIAHDYTEAIYPEVRRSAVQVSFDKAKIVKQVKSPKESNDSLLIEIRKSKNKKLNRWDLQGDMLTEYEQMNIGIDRDTVWTIDPINYDETGVYVENIINGNHIINVRFVQDWYWDEKLKKLKVNFVYYAPIFNRYDHNGNILYEAAVLFYEKMMKTKFDKQENKKK